MKGLCATLCLTIISCIICLAQPNLSFVEIPNNFDRPVDIANAGDGSNRLFIVDQTGYIRIFDSTGTILSEPFLNIDSKVSTNGERGLLGMAFHPDYADNGYFFVNYINNDQDTRVARYKVSEDNPNKADSLSEKVLIALEQPGTNHNGGSLHFSPVDGYLYIAFGDGGGSGDPDCYGQNRQSFHGKILRIDVDQNVDSIPYYAVPEDNPFVDDSTMLDEIWCLGLRNPWKFAFDRDNGNMWIADVGQGEQEEVNLQLASSVGGENYGWKVMEGMFCHDPDGENCPTGTPGCSSAVYTDPLFFYTHSETEGGRSITGGYVYRGCKYPALEGLFIMADYIEDHVWLLDSLGNKTFFNGMPRRITSFGESESGELYAVGINTSMFYEIRETGVPYDLEIDIADSPLTGTYEAVNSIIVKGDVEVAAGDTVFLVAPKIEINNDVDLTSSSIVHVKKRCD